MFMFPKMDLSSEIKNLSFKFKGKTARAICACQKFKSELFRWNHFRKIKSFMVLAFNIRQAAGVRISSWELHKKLFKCNMR